MGSRTAQFGVSRPRRSYRLAQLHPSFSPLLVLFKPHSFLIEFSRSLSFYSQYHYYQHPSPPLLHHYHHHHHHHHRNHYYHCRHYCHYHCHHHRHHYLHFHHPYHYHHYRYHYHHYHQHQSIIIATLYNIYNIVQNNDGWNIPIRSLQEVISRSGHLENIFVTYL